MAVNKRYFYTCKSDAQVLFAEKLVIEVVSSSMCPDLVDSFPWDLLGLATTMCFEGK
jgi:hypothetical protein